MNEARQHGPEIHNSTKFQRLKHWLGLGIPPIVGMEDREPMEQRLVNHLLHRGAASFIVVHSPEHPITSYIRASNEK